MIQVRQCWNIQPHPQYWLELLWHYLSTFGLPILKDYKVFQLGITKWMIFWYIPKQGGGSFLILFLQTFGVLNGPFDQMFGIFPIILDHEAVPYLQKLFLFLYLLCMSGGKTGTILGLLTLISSWPQRQNGEETNLSCRKHSTEHSTTVTEEDPFGTLVPSKNAVFCSCCKRPLTSYMSC